MPKTIEERIHEEKKYMLNKLIPELAVDSVDKRVFLGGTCNESTWRDVLIPMLKIDYFNPVVDDWTEECMAEEIRQREICDYCLYTITPKMTGVYSIAEVVDDSNKRPRKTILVILKADGDRVFSEGQWKSMHALAKMVSQNQCAVFATLRDAANYLNESAAR